MVALRLMMPTRLPFHVPALPRGMLEKARWYVEHEETHIMKMYDYEHPEYSDETPVCKWYVLRKDNADKIKKLTDSLIGTYETIVHGASRRTCVRRRRPCVALVWWRWPPQASGTRSAPSPTS